MPSHFNHLHPQKVTEDDTGGSVEPNYQEVHKVSTQPQPAQPTSPTTKVLGSSQPPRPGSHSIHVSGKFHKRTIEVFMLASLNNFPFRHDMRKSNKCVFYLMANVDRHRISKILLISRSMTITVYDFL